MNEEQIKQYYERIEKLLNGANKETYGFAPEEIRQILKWYEVLQQENQQQQQLLKDKGFIIDKLMEENRQLKEKLKCTNKGLAKVINRSTKYKRKYYKSKHIIDELEKWLEENKYFYSGLQGEDLEEDTTIIEVLNKLQELKGSDKE